MGGKHCTNNFNHRLNQPLRLVIFQSVSQSKSLKVSPSATQSVGQLISQSVSNSSGQSVYHHVRQSVGQLVSHTVSLSIILSLCLSEYESNPRSEKHYLSSSKNDLEKVRHSRDLSP